MTQKKKKAKKKGALVSIENPPTAEDSSGTVTLLSPDDQLTPTAVVVQAPTASMSPTGGTQEEKPPEKSAKDEFATSDSEKEEEGDEEEEEKTLDTMDFPGADDSESSERWKMLSPANSVGTILGIVMAIFIAKQMHGDSPSCLVLTGILGALCGYKFASRYSPALFQRLRWDVETNKYAPVSLEVLPRPQ